MTLAIQYKAVGVPNAGSSTSLALSGVTAGNSLVLIALAQPQGYVQSFGGVTDTNGTWPSPIINVAANTEFGLQVWLLSSAAAGSHSVTVGSGAFGDLILMEVPPTAGLDVYPYTLSASNTATSLSQSATTTVTDNLLAIFAYSDATGKSLIAPSNPPSGWTPEVYEGYIYNGTVSQSAYEIASQSSQPAGTHSATWSFTNNAYYSVELTAIIALKAPGGGSNALAGTGQQQPGAAGQLSVAVPLQAVAIQAQGASGGITVMVPLVGSSAAQQQASGALSAGVALSGNAVATQQANGSLSISVPLAASSVQQALARAALAVGVPLAGSSAQQTAAAGALSIHVSLAGEQLQQAIAAATLTNIPAGAVDLVGASGQQQGASGRLSVGKNLSGATLAIQGASGSLAVGVPLSGTSVQASRATGSLAVGVTLSGASLQQALASAALSNVGAIDLSGASGQQQAGAGALQLQIHLTAEALQQVAAVATLGVSTIPTYQGTGRFYAAAPELAFYAAPRRAYYAAAPATSFYGSA